VATESAAQSAKALAREPKNRAAFAFAQKMLESPEVAEAYEALFGDLRLAPPLQSGNAILVTSAAPGEGKTTVATCLAITASRAGRTALLIDGDLRRPALTAEAGSADTPGFLEVILGEVDAADAIRPVAAAPDSAGVGAVSVMSGGRKPPMLLGAVDWTRARSAFRAMSQGFDYVFLDSPPILAANDALLFAGVVDAVLLVVGAGNGNLDEIRRAKEQLEAIGTPIVGAVLNRFEPKLHGPSNRPYSGYYQPARA